MANFMNKKVLEELGGELKKIADLEMAYWNVGDGSDKSNDYALSSIAHTIQYVTDDMTIYIKQAQDAGNNVSGVEKAIDELKADYDKINKIRSIAGNLANSIIQFTKEQ